MKMRQRKRQWLHQYPVTTIKSTFDVVKYVGGLPRSKQAIFFSQALRNFLK